MQDEMILLTVIAKMLKDNGVHVNVNRRGKYLANQFYLEGKILADFEGRYKDIVWRIRRVLDTPDLDDFVCVERIVSIMKDADV